MTLALLLSLAVRNAEILLLFFGAGLRGEEPAATVL